jgi:tetratricopeptide (TPR) repeat protein
LSKKQLKGDRFVERTFDWAHWIETHRTQAIAAIVVLVMVGAGLFLWRRSASAADERASVEYLRARQSYFAGNWALAVSDLQGFVTRHGGSSYEDDATFFLADALYQAGQFPQAIETLEGFLDEHGDSPLADNARALMAASYQQAGQLPQAIAMHQRALEDAETDQEKIEIRHALARIYEGQGDGESAANQYRAIVEIDPEGDAAREARRKLAELTVRPIQAGAAAAESAPVGDGTAAPGESGALAGAPGADGP